MLHNFGVCIMRHLEDNADWMAERRATLALEKGMELAPSAVMMCDTSQDGWPICFSNQRWAFLTGMFPTVFCWFIYLFIWFEPPPPARVFPLVIRAKSNTASPGRP